MTIYEQFLEGVSEGKKFSVDFKRNNMKLGNKYLIENGNYNGDLLESVEPLEIINTIESLFKKFSNSVPNKHSDKKRSYFKAKPVDDLTEYDLVIGEEREVAQAALEGFVLCAKLAHLIVWPNAKWWFWRSENEPELVILREWIE